MPLPSLVFVDTCVFERQHFNFDGPVLASFAEVASRHDITLLMPEPTRAEVGRHMAERADEAVRSLESIRRQVPFLRSWPMFAPVDAFAARQAATRKFSDYLGRFPAVDLLNYDKVDVATVMQWYESKTSPFGERKKRKEFPDAIVIEMLRQHAAQEGQPIAVVSHDGDMKQASDRLSSLLHFEGLAALTEVLLIRDEHEQKVLVMVAGSRDVILEAVKEEAKGFLFMHSDTANTRIRHSRLVAARLDLVHLIGIGAGMCTVVYEATLQFEHDLDVLDWVTQDVDWKSTELLEEQPMRGAAKLTIDPAVTRVTGVASILPEDVTFIVRGRPQHIG